MNRLIILFLFFHPAFLFSQDTSVLTSAKAIQLALENNLSIKLVEADREIAQVNNNWGNAGKWPTVNLNIGNTEALSNLNQVLSNGNVIKRNGVSNNFLNGSLVASWRVYNGHRIEASKQRLDELEKIGEINLRQEMQRISFEVLATFYNIVRLHQQVKAINAILSLSKERNTIARTRFEVGSAAKTDMLQSEIDLNEQLVNLRSFEQQIELAKASLNTLLKRPVDYPISIGDTSFHIPDLKYEDIISRVDTQNLDLMRAERQRAILAEDRRIIQSGRLPVVTLNSTTSYNRTQATGGFFLTNQTYGPNIGVNISIPIFNSNQFKTQARVNTIQQRQQLLQKEQIRNELLRDIYAAFLELKNAKEVATMEEQNVRIATENNFIATERFKKLQGNSIELRQAQLSLIQAQDRYINALFRQKIAASGIQLIVGELGNE